MIYKIIGCFFVGLAFLGVALPLLPTTPFLLVAAACFAKSSPRLYKKLLDNKLFGPLILNWQRHGVISKRAKTIALSSIFLSCLWSCYLLPHLYLQVFLIVLLIFPVIYLWRLPTQIK